MPTRDKSKENKTVTMTLHQMWTQVKQQRWPSPQSSSKLHRLILILLLMIPTLMLLIKSPTSRNMVIKEDDLTSFADDQGKVQLRRMWLPRCQCSKLVPSQEQKEAIEVRDTTCQESTLVRGPHQKVIAFTFYDLSDSVNDPEVVKHREEKAKRHYFKGIKENLELMKTFYPGFVMRVYYDVKESNQQTMDQLCTLACHEPLLDLCDAANNARLHNATKLYPLIWRFLPVMDSQVDLFFSRDLDSRINDREVAAVDEFFKSNKQIHIMRDHPAHTAQIMGGLWGAKLPKLRKKFITAMRRMFKDPMAYAPRHMGGYDQLCLGRYVWLWGRHVAMSHDSYLCLSFPHTSPFPTKRGQGVGNHVGSVINLNGTIQEGPGSVCPKECRPKDHQDWIYC